MQPLTDEERKKLCEALRRKARAGSWRVPMCAEAADEIERLEKRVAKLENELEDIRYWENVSD